MKYESGQFWYVWVFILESDSDMLIVYYNRLVWSAVLLYTIFYVLYFKYYRFHFERTGTGDWGQQKKN